MISEFVGPLLGVVVLVVGVSIGIKGCQDMEKYGYDTERTIQLDRNQKAYDAAIKWLTK